MSNGDCRRSTRILELEARKPQKEVNKMNSGMSLDTTEDQFSRRQRRRKAEVNHTLGVKARDSGETFAESCNTPLPQISALELLLDMLTRRDTLKIFAEPVDSAKVKGYYDVVKDPMDFATISTKLSRGKYRILEEFESDVFLVFSNAMLFNDSKTVYYRQARAIKEVSKKLFTMLRTDANKFECELSQARGATSGWSKADARILNSNSCNQPKDVITTVEVSESEGAMEHEGVERRATYKTQTSYQNENLDYISAVLNAPRSAKTLVHINQSSLSDGQNFYKESLLRFSKGMGPVVDRVVQKKLNRFYFRENHRQQAPCPPPVYGNPFGSPVRTSDHNENAQQADPGLETTSTPDGGIPPIFSGMSVGDILLYLSKP